MVGYKLIKGAAEALASAALLAAIPLGLSRALGAAARALREHVLSQWSARLADALLSLAEASHLHLLILGLALDAVFTLFEGWALHRRFRWAPFLVVGATAALVPFEVASLARGLRAGRLLMLAANLAVVALLLSRALRERR